MSPRSSFPTSRPTSRHRRALHLAGVVVVSGALLAAGCSTAQQSVESQQKPTDEVLPDDGAPQDGGTLVVGIYQETSGWNPTYDRWAQMGALVGSSILEPLAALDENGVAQPWLATSWDTNPEFTSWTIHLREGVVFQDGSTFDADSVKANIDDATLAPLTGLAFKPLIGGSTKVDAHTIRVDLLTPWAAFPTAYLASQGAMQRSPKSIAERTGSEHPVGTGPFAFKDWKRDSSLIVEKNTRYWRQGEPHLDRIEFRPIIEDGSRAAALRSNDIDMMFTTSAKDAADLDQGFTVVRDWDTESTMLIANTREKVGDELNPMRNIHARRAIAMSTDRKYLAALIGNGVQQYNSPFAPDSPWGQPDDQAGYPAYNLDEARKEVAAYLADTGQREMNVSVIGVADTNSGAILQALQTQWADVGITSTVKTVDATALIQGLLGSTYDLAMASIYSAPDPDQDFVFWSKDFIGDYGKLSVNFPGFTSAKLEQLMAESRTTVDPAKRRDLTNQIVRELNANVTQIWMYATPFSLVAADRVHGVRAIADLPFASYQAKTWWGEIWLAH